VRTTYNLFGRYLHVQPVGLFLHVQPIDLYLYGTAHCLRELVYPWIHIFSLVLIIWLVVDLALMLYRRSVTSITLLVNTTPFVWISKRHRLLSLLVLIWIRICCCLAVLQIDLIVKVRYKFRVLGLVMEKETLLVDHNISVVLNTTSPSSSLKKNHLSCSSYHWV
jgi:hypothetical protein